MEIRETLYLLFVLSTDIKECRLFHQKGLITFLLLSTLDRFILANETIIKPNQPLNVSSKCLPNPCFNDAICDVSGDSYVCRCLYGYTGARCQTDIDECSSSPCLNGARCYNGIGEYRCECHNGFGGDRCQTDLDECHSNPCFHGRCLDGSNRYSCVCQKGYSGLQCGKEKDKCVSDTCLNGATCSGTFNGYYCKCQEGFKGKNCQDVDDCVNHRCLNGGKCIDGLKSYKCICMGGYQGKRCEIDIDECASNPCKNGICVQDVNKYTCICDSGFTGTRCQRKVKYPPTGHSSFSGAHVVFEAGLAMIVIVVLLFFVIKASSQRTFHATNYQSSTEGVHLNPEENPQTDSQSPRREEQTRADDLFAEEFVFNLQRMLSNRIQQTQMNIKRRQEYANEFTKMVDKLDIDEDTLLGYLDIVWPSTEGQEHDKAVLFDGVDTETEEGKKYLREQKIRWHPDRFMQKFGKHLNTQEMETILDRVTVISQDINRLTS